MRDKIRVDATGDAVGGWIVDVHDGERNEVYRPEAATKEEAAEAALNAHMKLYFPEGHPLANLPDSTT